MAALSYNRFEIFALAIFKGMSQKDAAIVAGYKESRAYETASRLVRYGKVKARIEELHAKAESDAVMSVHERKARLSEIARARLSDFITAGPDGSWINIGPESIHSAALQEIISRTEYDENGANPAVIIRIKLHEPVKAINELNKMDGSLAPTRVTGGEGEPLYAPIINLHMPDGTVVKASRNGNEAEAVVGDHSDNGH